MSRRYGVLSLVEWVLLLAALVCVGEPRGWAPAFAALGLICLWDIRDAVEVTTQATTGGRYKP